MGVSGRLSPEELDIRRRVVWSAFSELGRARLHKLTAVLDKVISLYQGREVSFHEEKMHVPHRFLDMYEERELWMPFAYPVNKPYPGTPARGISTFTALCSLSVIMVCCSGWTCS